jgi:hypothetical protein
MLIVAALAGADSTWLHSLAPARPSQKVTVRPS